MALTTIIVLLSGLLGFSLDISSNKSVFVCFGWAVLAGLYSQPALEKLKDVFEALFSKSKS